MFSHANTNVRSLYDKFSQHQDEPTVVGHDAKHTAILQCCYCARHQTVSIHLQSNETPGL
jgi:nucleotidyltransferase/DNA polymerase involved in DNA repair